MVQKIEPYATDLPELGSIVLRVYPPVASIAISKKTQYATVTTGPYYQDDDGDTTPNPVTGSLLQTKYSVPQGYSGPLQPGQVPENFVGPLAPIVTTTAVGSTISVAQGSFSSQPTEFDYFLSYEYDEDFLTPCDGSSFTLATDQLSDTDLLALVRGARVEVSIDGNMQSIGYIDDIETSGSRASGSTTTIHVRDWMSPAVDCHVDPNTSFKPSMTLLDLLSAVFAPFGMQVLDIANEANRNAITGRIYGTPTTKKSKPLKSYILHEIKPYPQEGAFTFASRISQRFGLWLWPMVDGKTIVVGQPDFDQPSRYSLRLKTDGSQHNNVLDWSVRLSRADQPSIIFGSGFGGGGEFPHSSLRGVILNPMASLPPVLDQILAAYPGITLVTPPTPAMQSGGLMAMREPNVRPLYLYDPESHDAAQIQAFLRRELSLRMRKALTATYTIMGHKLGGQPIAVDSMIDVDDDIAGIHMPLWIQKRHFMKRAGSQGTTTRITCILPGSLFF